MFKSIWPKGAFLKLLNRCLAIALIALLNWGILSYPVMAKTAKTTSVDIEQLLKELPTGDRWIAHLKEDLLPFWEMETALGQPVGNFPTYRCNDGSLYNPNRPCPELQFPAPGIVWLDRDYVRAKSRQVYAYGIAFHLTGDETYLNYAKAGVDYLRSYALDQQNGGAYTYWLEPDHNPNPPVKERTSQDLAYALTGMGFYYYLTREPAILKDIVRLKDYIFETYYDRELDLITWVKEESPDKDQPNQKELVAQLDQVYGYMLWLTPAMPEPYQTAWKKDLTHLAQIMVDQFYSPKQNIFWGAVTNSKDKHLETPHTDFGHSVKTLWLIYEIGKLTDNLDLTLFAQVQAGNILKEAYIEETGSWARRLNLDGTLDKDKEWWILAELDQVAATLALVDPAYGAYLPKTYDYWFTQMVDKEHGGVWHMVSAKTNQPYPCKAQPPSASSNCFPKQHSWKNALHSFEHALVGYITMQQLQERPVSLYYAFSKVPDKSLIEPYFYSGKVADIVPHQGAGSPGMKTYEVIFTDIV